MSFVPPPQPKTLPLRPWLRGALVALALLAASGGACPRDGYLECTGDEECNADAGLVCDGRTATCMYPEDIAARCVECLEDAECGSTECECNGQVFLSQNTCVGVDGGCASCVTTCACP